MARFIKVGTTSELQGLQGGKLVEAGGQSVALFNVNGSYFAIENTCPHAGGPLAEGPLDGDVVTCPWHGSRFNVKTGAVLAPPARRSVKSFPVRVTGSDVEIEVE
jgi:nitrite reductase/ring-hydroxylating ferredoxin subunit